MDKEQQAKLEDEARRGEQARQVTDNPVFAQAFHMLQAHYLAKFEATSWEDDKARKEIWLSLKNLQQIENQLKQVINTGKLANRTLLDKAKDFIKR